MEKSQREYYLNEQNEAIQKELGEMDDAPNEIAEIEKKIARAVCRRRRGEGNSELAKLKLMSPMSAEATVVRNYVDWLVKVPWRKRTKVKHDLAGAEQVLNEDHYGLEKVKERIRRVPRGAAARAEAEGPDPVPGRPSGRRQDLARPVDRACHQPQVRAHVARRVRDEAEIRGHRRTYIGSMPGKIVQNMARTGVRNPLFLLDEVDKMAMDFRGDPSPRCSRCLIRSRTRHSTTILEVDFDLSEVMFVCTANS